jgi:hypothetical protein
MRPFPNRYYHAVPLHRLPYLLYPGALYSHATLREKAVPLGPRPTVAARDRKLRLTGYVHLALESVTPLLRDKLRKGYPHALLAFAGSVAELPGAAFLRFNPKSWRHRDDFVPLVTAEEKALFRSEWQSGLYPSAELLIPDSLPLANNLNALYFCSDAEQHWLGEFENRILPGLPIPAVAAPDFLPPCEEFDWSPFTQYASDCRAAGSMLPPPDLPFD